MKGIEILSIINKTNDLLNQQGVNSLQENNISIMLDEGWRLRVETNGIEICFIKTETNEFYPISIEINGKFYPFDDIVTCKEY